ncbi:MAG TPA: FAD-dependent monooxygenase [Pseudomonadales bacterium]|nr:FAD-dependent monooxygenase [Pseudomonadales bacterium]
MSRVTAARPILVAGGGIGGLSAALCLARRGFPVRVLEQAEAFTEAGAGIQLSPNGMRVLRSLGLEARLLDVGFEPEAVEIRSWDRGRLLASTPLGAAARARWGAPCVHVHRGDLLTALVDAARADDAIELVAGAGVVDVEDHGGGVRVAGPGFEAEGSVLIGADGIHSRVRAFLFGAEAPRFTGNVAWRALVPAAALAAGLVRPTATVWWGPGAHFVHYYVRGGDLVNCVGVVEASDWREESWTRRGDPGELRRAFGAWHPDLQALLDGVDADSCYRWALFDRPPMSSWGRGRVTLLGDACHATLPFLAQGAVMAIEDGALLARCLEAVAEPAAALERYAALRRARTARVQRASRRNARIFHLRGPAALARNLFAGLAADRVSRDLYAYDALGVSLT